MKLIESIYCPVVAWGDSNLLLPAINTLRETGGVQFILKVADNLDTSSVGVKQMVESCLHETGDNCTVDVIELGDNRFRVSIASKQPATNGASLKDIVHMETVRVERELITRALGEASGNVSQAARALKISRKSLQNKMKGYGIPDKPQD